MSLTTNFTANVPVFMAAHVLLLPAQVPAGNGQFQLTAQGAHAVVIGNAGGGPAITGWIAQPVADSNNVSPLPTQQPGDYYVLTAAMNGCQWLAYGPDRQHVTVEHNNWISAPQRYTARLAAITAQHHQYFWHMTAGPHSNINNGIYDRTQGVNIAGHYTAQTGWNFWVRDRVDQNNGTIYAR